MNPQHHLVLRVVAKTLIPVIALFAFYVQFHGDYGPGGGFQAGVILAVSVILYALIFGIDEARRAIPPWLVRTGCAVGVLIYGGVGLLTFLLGGEFLNYDMLSAHPEDPMDHHGQHLGIMLVELGVLATVSSTMLAVFYAFAGRTPDIADEEW
jgi:multicomponent Na+:H+ antiporter subunit B